VDLLKAFSYNLETPPVVIPRINDLAGQSGPGPVAVRKTRIFWSLTTGHRIP